MATKTEMEVGSNIKAVVEGNVLVLRIDLSKNFGESKSGKSTIIATTSGNAKVPGTKDVVLGLNLYTKK